MKNKNVTRQKCHIIILVISEATIEYLWKTWYNNTDFNTTILSSSKSVFGAKRETGERPVQSCYCKCVVFSMTLYEVNHCAKTWEGWKNVTA